MLASLAKKFANLHNNVGGKYLAGIWGKSLLDDLLWAHAPIDVGHNATRCRHLEYRAPSWSWTAVDGNVRWLDADQNGEGPYYTEVLQAHIELAGSSQDPFGCDSVGSISLSGSLKRLDYLVTGSQVQRGPVEAFARKDVWATFYGEIYPDVSINEHIYEADARAKRTGSSGVWLLHIKQDVILILGLEEGGTSGALRVFKRLGVIISRHNLSWEEEIFGDIEKETFEFI